MEPNKPAHALRYGAVQAAIWENSSDSLKTTYFSVSLSRQFKSGEEWKESRTFLKSDLPTVAKIAADAHTWIDGEVKRRRESAPAEVMPTKRPRSKQPKETGPLDLH